MTSKNKKLLMLLFLAATATAVRAADQATPEMAVTATRVERQIFETPQAITVIDDNSIEQSTASDTPSLLQGAEGMYVQRTNLGGGSPFIRGLTGKQVLILVDGVRLNNSFYRFGPHQYLNTLDPHLIERIEIVRGPASVLYGSDALGGTINVITRRRDNFSAAQGINGSAQARYEGAANAYALSARAEGNSGGVGYLGGVTDKHYGDLEGGGSSGKQIPSAYQETDADLKINWQLGAGQELIFANQYVRQSDVPKTNEITLGNKLKFDYDPQDRLLSYLEYRGANLGAFEQVRANLSYNRQKEGEQIIARATPTIETRELTDVATLGGTLQLTQSLGARQRFTYGLEYYADRFQTDKQRLDLATGASTPQVPGTPDGATYDGFGAYLQDELRLGAGDIIAGVRYSRYTADGSIGVNQLSLDVDDWTGSLNALYRLTPRLNLVGGLAQGFRAPNMEDFFGRVDFVSEIPNTQLQPETSVTREIGLKYYTSQVSGDIYYHYTDYDGFIDRVTVAPGVRQRRNIQNAVIHGVETGWRYALSDTWSTAVTAAWTHGEDQDTGLPLRRIPPLNGSLALRYSPSVGSFYELVALLASRQDRLSQGDIDDPRIGPDGTPGYSVFNLRSGYRPARNQELLIALENLGDKQYKTHGSGVYAPGRSLNLSYRVGFK